MRTIKFRGHGFFSNSVVYGFYWEDERGNSFIVDSSGKRTLVKRETVALLVDYDKGGNEVYEGDIVTFIDSSDNVIEQEAVLFDNIPSYAVLKKINNETQDVDNQN